MILDSNDYLYSLRNVLAEDLNMDWDSLIPYALDVKKKNEEGNYYTDVYGNPIYDRSDVEVYYLQIFNKIHPLHDIVKHRFEKSISKLNDLAGLTRAFMVFVAPNSVIPTHIDDLERPVWDPSTHWNFLLGIHVPSEDINHLGLCVNTDTINQITGSATAFDANIPHQAWNRTTEWWIAVVLLINKEYFINGRYIFQEENNV